MLDARELALGVLLLFGTLLALVTASGQKWQQTLTACGLLVGLGAAAIWSWVQAPIHSAPSLNAVARRIRSCRETS